MDKNFKNLLTRFVNGDCTPEEREKVNQWYEKIADHELELEEDEKRVIGSRMFLNIQNASRQQREPLSMQRSLYRPILLRVAAAVLLLTVFGLWLFTGNGFLQNKVPDKIVSGDTEVVYENETNDSRLYKLPDGSTVRLEAFSSLIFRKDFSGGIRKVHLSGTAFFDVVKDLSKPFYVYSGKVGTRVLGTSFFVDAPADAKKVAVRVVTGKVSVFEIEDQESSKNANAARTNKSTANGVVLSPNQQVEYFLDGGHWVTGLVEDPVPVKPIDLETLSFVFSNTSISNVFEDAEERFGIEVVTENENILRCTFTGDVSKMALYDMLEVICNSIGATYELKGTRILVSGKGCIDASPKDIIEKAPKPE